MGLIFSQVFFGAVMTIHTMHIKLTPEDIQGARYAILPGDPGRVEKIAKKLERPKPLASSREYTSYLGFIKKVPIVVCSTGIGGPSTSICVEELAEIGVRTFIRVGTTGAIQPDIALGDMIIVNASLRLDGASGHFAPPEFPAVSDFFVTKALWEAAQQKGVRYHLGITASSDTFYPGQERYNTFSGRVASRFRGSMQEWQDLGVLNYEMESATLFTMCQTMRLRAGCIAGVVATRNQSESIQDGLYHQTVEHTVDLSIQALEKLIAAQT